MPADAPDAPVQVDRRGPAAVVTFCRPHRRNALDAALVADLAAAVQAADADPSVRAVVLCGGGGHFSPGLDLHDLHDELAARPLDGSPRVWALGAAGDDLLGVVEGCSTPTVAAVEGVAAGIGAGLVGACDVAVLARTARIGYPEVRSGVQLDRIVTRLARLVGDRVARRLLLGGEMLDADAALALGLVTEVVDGPALTAALAWADRLAEQSPDALAATKRMLDPATPAELRRPWLTPDSAEGAAAFVQRRTPTWAPGGVSASR